MVTASHNPPQDNGYKVYRRGRARRSCRRPTPRSRRPSRAVGPLSTVPLADGYDGARRRGAGVVPGPRSPPCRSDRRTVGCGRSTPPCTGSAPACCGPPSPGPASRRRPRWPSRPSPTRTSRPSPSPTRRSPARSTWRWRWPRGTGADLVIANDPDADRCAVAVPDRPARLAGADRRRGRRAARRPPDPRAAGPGTYATTIVSSSLLGALCAGPRACRYAETLTGFKWIVRGRRRPRLRLRGGARLLRAAGRGAGQGRDLRGAAGRRPGRRARGRAAARCWTGWTSWPPSSACTPPRRSRSGSTDLAEIGAAMARAAGRAADRAAGPAGRPPSRTCCPDADVRPAARRRRPGRGPAERHRAEAQGVPGGRRPGPDGDVRRGAAAGPPRRSPRLTG